MEDMFCAQIIVMSGDMMSLEAARGFPFVRFFQIDHKSLSDLNRFNLSYPFSNFDHD